MADLDAIYKGVGQRVRKAREAKRLTQARLAEMVSLSRTSITNIELGRQKLLVHTLWDIAEALGVDVRQILPTKLATKPVSIDDKIPEDLSQDERRWIKRVVGEGMEGGTR